MTENWGSFIPERFSNAIVLNFCNWVEAKLKWEFNTALNIKFYEPAVPFLMTEMIFT